jgi:uncharacterized protein
MSDMDRRSGAVISNFQSALQSVEIIIATRLGEVVMLREFGAGLSELLGRLMTPQLFVVFETLLATAIDLWEPRFQVRKIVVTGSPDALRRGSAGFRIEVDYRPQAHHGDLTVEGIRSFDLSFGRGDVLARAA